MLNVLSYLRGVQLQRSDKCITTQDRASHLLRSTMGEMDTGSMTCSTLSIGREPTSCIAPFLSVNFGVPNTVTWSMAYPLVWRAAAKSTDTAPLHMMEMADLKRCRVEERNSEYESINSTAFLSSNSQRSNSNAQPTSALSDNLK